VLFMLEGHVLRELLAPEVKMSPFFTFHEIFHGVTAPGFLFGAGFTFAIATQRRWEQTVIFSFSFFRRVWRAIALICIGYALHFPFLSLQKTLLVATPTQWDAFLLFDVLQCIGLGLLLMRLLVILLKQEKLFMAALAMLLLSVVYLTPLFWLSALQSALPRAVSSACNGLTGSPFPLFPFGGFLLAGACVSWIFLRAAQGGREEICIRWLMFTGGLLVLIGVLFDAAPFQTYAEYMFWSTSPNYFWIRLGVLLLMLGALWYLEDLFATQGGSFTWMPAWLTVLGRESLFVYIAHLLILCGWVVNVEFNLRWWWGTKLNIAEAVFVFGGLTLTMIPASFAWRYLKKNHHLLMNGVFWWMGVCIAWSFLFNPY